MATLIRRWSQSTIQSLIADFDKLFQYAGYGFWNRRNWQTGACRPRDLSEWVIVENAHPAIISEEEAKAILATTKQNIGESKKCRNKPESRFALSGGVLVCGRCGSRFAGKKTDNDYYLCGSHIYRNGSGCGPSWYLRKNAVEELVFRKIVARIDKDRVDEWVAGLNREIDEEWQAFKKTAKERGEKLEALEREMSNLLSVAADVGNNPDVVKRIRDTSAVISDLRSLQNLRKPPKVSSADILKRAGKVVKYALPARLHTEKKPLDCTLEN